MPKRKGLRREPKPAPKPAPKSPAPSTVRFHYIKSPGFRTTHVDGFIGGRTPAKFIHLAGYAERGAVPQTVEHDIDSDGKVLQPPRIVNTRGGIVREMQFDMVMSIQCARALHEWIGLRLKESEE